MQEIDHRDRELLSALQNEVPLASTPWAIIGQSIDMSEKEVIKRTERLKRDGHIRHVSGIFDPRAFGYRSSLVAARVDPENIERAAGIISGHPGVYQNYRRNHDFNLWFTIAVPPNSRLGLERTIEILGDEAECEVIRLLPAIRSYKSADAGEAPHEEAQGSESSFSGSHEPLTEREIEFVRLLQKDLPLHPRPFEALARPTGISAEDLLQAARTFRSRQQLRRFGAIVPTRRAPFSASVMGVWRVPAEEADAFGAEMAANKSVSQCYLRPTYPDWPYNIFTIVHGRSVDECESILAELSSASGVSEMQALFPVKEFKRTRLAFFSPDTEAWEAPRGGGASQSAVS